MNRGETRIRSAVVVAAGLLWLFSARADARFPAPKPLIDPSQCFAIDSPQGPEDLVAIPNQKAILVSSAKRSLLTRKPHGRIVRMDLEPCFEKRERGCALKETIYESPERSSPVGIVLAGKDDKELFLVESGRECRVLALPLDDQGRVPASCRQGQCANILGTCEAERPWPDLTPALNGIGVSSYGDVLVTNAMKEPSMALRPARSDEWIAIEDPDLRFANGLAFFPVGLDPAELPERHVLVADFLARKIHLLRVQGGGKVDSVCAMPTPRSPDNLHWDPGREGRKLLVGSFASTSTSTAYFLHLRRKVAATAWSVDLTSLARRLANGETPPKDCGIGSLHWTLLVRDEESEVLSGASAAIRVDGHLVVGQLRRPELWVCSPRLGD